MAFAPAALFDSANGELLSRASNTTLQTGDVSYWLAGWVWADSLPAVYSVVASKADSVASIEYDLYLSQAIGHQFLFEVYTVPIAVVGSVAASSFGTVPTGQWVFVLVWYDTVGNTVNIRVNDGAINSEPTTGAPVATASSFRIGADSSPPAGFWDGRIAAVVFGKSPPGGIASVIANISASLYNVGAGKLHSALSSAEKTAWGVVSYWNLNEESDGTAAVTRYDSQGTNHLSDNNTVVSTAGIVETVAFGASSFVDVDSLDEDIEYVDGLEEVTYVVRDLEGAEGRVITRLHAFREQLSNDPSEGTEGWQKIQTRTVWHLKGNSMSGVIPKRGDRITSAASGTWEVAGPMRPCIGRWFEVDSYAVAV